MLHILMGRANTGKSAAILRRIGEAGSRRPQVLLVPEHASHAAEVDLCRACGDGASRFAEVLTLPRLAVRVLSRAGGLAQPPLDRGGKVLMMQRAMEEVASQLRLYRRPSQKAAFLEGMVDLSEELQRYAVAPEDLMARGEAAGGVTGDKLRDIALVCAAYQAGLSREGKDLRDLLTRLEEALEPSGYLAGKDVYLDGFAYLSVQEERLLAAMLRQAASVTVALLGEKDSGAEEFRMGLVTQQRLQRLAAGAGCPAAVETLPPPPVESALGHLERHIFGDLTPWTGAAEEVTLYRAETMFSEAEYVAAQIRELVASGRCRYRDIGVAARNLPDYEATIENVFRRYGIPVYMSRRSDILEKPVMTLILSALETVEGGWEYEDLFRCLKTGLSDLEDEELFLLENYVIKWDIRGKLWRREEPWSANPDGYAEEFTDLQRQTLDRVNRARERVRRPLMALADGLRTAGTAGGKLRALCRWLEDIALPQRLEERSAALLAAGENQLAEEYRQLWELLCQVFDQFDGILGEAPMDTETFLRLLKLVLTQYSVGTIPAALDQVHLSDVSRNDRHRTRCLFLIGANDGVLPQTEQGRGILTQEERAMLTDSGLRLAPDGLDQFSMELQNIYAALAKAEDRLWITWPAGDRRGAELRPSFVVERVRQLLPGAVRAAEGREKPFRLAALRPALETAGSRPGGRLWRWLGENPATAPALRPLERAAAMTRGRLGPAAVRSLYGPTLRLSPSRVDKLQSCHFAYFMRYGLRARERAPAGFDAARVGDFLHYVLEHVTREAMERGGFAALDGETLRALTDRWVDRFTEETLGDLDQREARFRHLFRRLRRTVYTVVENAAGELRESAFRPVAFELSFGEGGDLPAITIREGETTLAIGGRADRVDGWLKDGRLYLRVVDYKSGKRSFDLADVYYGLNLQMLLYLFALEREGKALFGHDIVPAGVLYFPARDVLLNLDRGVSPEKLREAMDRELRRSGLLLADPEVLRAMEPGALEGPRYLPLTVKRDGSITSGVASAEQLGRLGRYTERVLRQIAREVSAGVIDADPRSRSENDSACTYCEFASACHFSDGRDGDRLRPIRPVEQADFWRHVDEVNGEGGEVRG